MKSVIIMLFLAFTGIVVEAQNVVYDENAEVRVVEKFNGIEGLKNVVVTRF